MRFFGLGNGVTGMGAGFFGGGGGVGGVLPKGADVTVGFEADDVIGTIDSRSGIGPI